ncbi:MAG: D-glycero-beta-D-manno-heptose 1,7-bisphosphate 7-phosphatase [Cellvibrionales bacterium]|nr:D-glycero-beta-D-manno-heptose 1,7-bisphosphate 7-phosphatase [Cellvibrionales bacterium]
MNRALFLDRDGIINVDKHYLYKPEEVEFIPGIFELCQLFQDNGFIIIVVTNQSGIARGYYTEEDFQRLTQWITNAFTTHHIHLSATYHCPHHPSITGECECRKPKIGMLKQAIKRFNIDPKQSLMIGDKLSDIEAASNAGLKLPVLVNEKSTVESLQPATQSLIVPSLKAALPPLKRWINDLD